MAATARRHTAPGRDTMTTRGVPKLTGCDVELGNFVVGLTRPGGTGFEASRALLRQVVGLPVRSPASLGSADPAAAYASRPPASPAGAETWGGASAAPRAVDAQDVGRKFLPGNAGCVYIDLNHCE